VEVYLYMVLYLRNCTHCVMVTGFQEPIGSWIPPLQFISPDADQQVTEKHYRHHSSVIISLLFVLELFSRDKA